MTGWIIFLICVAAAIYVAYQLIEQVTVFEYQKGLLYRNGSFEKTLTTGQYYFFAPRTEVEIYDIRSTQLTIPGQEILTKDKISVKVTLSGNYTIADPLKAKQISQYYMSDVYSEAQSAVRDAVAAVSLDELLEDRTKIDAQIFSEMKKKADALGLDLTALAIRDIILPANLKRAFAGVLEAQKEAQKQLEKARGEQAVLRSLANSSKMYDNNPSLLQARVLQSLADGKNTIVFGADGKTAIKESEASD